MEFAVDLAMITINRGQENYVHRTLESLFWCSRKLPLTVHLFVGDADLKYLERYRSDCRIRIHSPSEAEMEQMESIKLDGWRRMNYRCIVNYHRALQLEASRPDAFLVTFEDDVLFAPDFWPRLEATVMEAGVQTDRYVVTFYSTHDAPCSAKSTTLVPYPDAEGFYGNQCLFYPPRVRRELAAYVYRHGVIENAEPADRLVRTYVIANQVPLWQTYRSLVQHIGVHTTGVYTHWHASPTFGLPWRVNSKRHKQQEPAMQHVYSEIDGWFDFPDVYLNAVAQAVDGARFVEIGAYLGKSAAFMAVEITNSGKRIQFDVVDTWTLTPQQPIIPGDFEKYGRSTYGAFLSNMDKFGLRAIVNPIQGRSTEVAATYEDGSLDFVFIDADHSYDAVRADIAAWLPKVKHRGVLAGHDYDAGTHRAVVLAVDVALPLSQIQRCNRSWVFHNELPTVGHFVVPLSSEPREYLLYIPCVNGPELLAEAVDSVRDHWANLIIIDQSDEGIKDLWDGCIAIYRWTAESHFVRMQNWLQRHAMLERVPYFLFMHHDACCQNNAVQMVVDEARILDRIGERWGVIFTAYDALCLFSTHATIQVGAWDETFRWYVADIDYYNRMTWAGFRQVTSSRTIVQHHVSQTLRRLSPAERAAVEQNHSWAQAHYAHKWGGWNQQETHRIPYGG